MELFTTHAVQGTDIARYNWDGNQTVTFGPNA